MERENMREMETSEEGKHTKVVDDGAEIGDKEEVVEIEEGMKMVIGREIMEPSDDNNKNNLTNPFGTPITTSTLQMMPHYVGKTITQADRAREAMRMMAWEGKNIDALTHALNLHHSAGRPSGAVLALVYNATGTRVELVDGINWEGQMYEGPPRFFDNGQWISFLYRHGNWWTGSEGARVFRATDMGGNVRDFFLGWRIPFNTNVRNTAYTEVRGRNHFKAHWHIVRELLRRSRFFSFDETNTHFKSNVSIGGVKTAEFIAILEHKFGPLK